MVLETVSDGVYYSLTLKLNFTLVPYRRVGPRTARSAVIGQAFVLLSFERWHQIEARKGRKCAIALIPTVMLYKYSMWYWTCYDICCGQVIWSHRRGAGREAWGKIFNLSVVQSLNNRLSMAKASHKVIYCWLILSLNVAQSCEQTTLIRQCAFVVTAAAGLNDVLWALWQTHVVHQLSSGVISGRSTRAFCCSR